MEEFSFKHLTDVQFEEFCFDLLGELDMQNIDWRKGTDLNTSPSDRGRDIVCQSARKDIDGALSLETWFVECKHYRAGVPPKAIQGLLAWAEAKRPDQVLIIASGFLSNSAKDYLQEYQDTRNPPFRIRYWERPMLEKLTTRRRAILDKFGLTRANRISMKFSGSALSGKWWRFTKYAIADGNIKPAYRAQLQEYELTTRGANTGRIDLLAMLRDLGAQDETQKDFDELGFALARLGRKASRPFSLDRIDQIESIHPRSGLGLAPLMVDDLVFEPGPNHLRRLRRLSPLHARAESRILDWCAEYGLLGILSHIAESVYMAPRWWASSDGRRASMATCPVIPGWQRLSGSWSCDHRTLVAAEGSHPGRSGALADPSHVGECVIPGIDYGIAYVRHVDAYGRHSGVKMESIEDTWNCFFPDIPARRRTSFQCPRPLTTEFWRIYAEPLETFLRHALLLFEALTPGPHAYDLTPLTEPIRLNIENDEADYGRVVESAQFPSLLSAYAVAGL